MTRTIRFHVGDTISYYSVPHQVVEVFPYIAYIREVRNNAPSGKPICVGMGDLVMGGAYVVGRKNADIFTYSVAPRPERPTPSTQSA